MPVNWDFFHRHVQKGLPHGQFLSGRATVIGAGPPNVFAFSQNNAGSDSLDLVYLIGLSQSMTIQQGLAVQRFFEIGSDRHYFLTGRSTCTMGLNRILYHGPNLLRALYAYYSSTSNFTEIKSLLKRFKSMPAGVNNHTVEIPAGEQNFFINMMSDLFSQPVGLLLLLRDQNEITYGMAYAENCYVNGYTLSTDSNSIMMQEAVGIEAERIIPIGNGTVQLLQTIDEELLSNFSDGSGFTATT